MIMRHKLFQHTKCLHNLRVDEMIMTVVPLRGLNRTFFTSSMTGMRKASALPVPVLAAPAKSRPANRSGTDFAWIPFVAVNLISAMACRVSFDTWSLSKVKRRSMESSKVSSVSSLISLLSSVSPLCSHYHQLLYFRCDFLLYFLGFLLGSWAFLSQFGFFFSEKKIFQWVLIWANFRTMFTVVIRIIS